MSQNPNNRNQPVWEQIRLPLYRLYQNVKQLDRESGHSTTDTQSYLLLLETLRKGYMLTSADELFLLCEKLWLKPYHQDATPLNKAKLRQLFDIALYDFFHENEQPAAPPYLQPKTKKDHRSAIDNKPVPAKTDKPFLPSEQDKIMSLQQGELNVAVATVESTAGSGSLATPGFEDTFSEKEFLVKGIYLPVNPRRIEQSIRSYRYRLKGYGQQEIDWDKTIREIATTGYFDRFSFREKDFFTTGWTVLIDHSPSMIAFTAYGEEIAGAIGKGNSGDSDSIFYFQNYPVSHLFYNRLQSASIPFERFAAEPRRNILVISDAGAARGYVNEDRIKGTLKFLRRLQKHRIAWLNPMPKARWANTSAELIADHTDMFDIGEGTRDSLSNIVRLFKSKINTEKI